MNRITIIVVSPTFSLAQTALKSAEFADEILLVTTKEKNSNTKKVKQVNIPLENDFSKLRNQALKLASNDWVMFLDSDETISSELKKEINHFLLSPGHFKGAFIKRKDFFLGKTLQHGETSSAKLLRLAQKKAGVWVRPVHETWKIQGKITIFKHHLNHHPHSSISSFIKKINFYTNLEAKFRHQKGDSFSIMTTIFYPLAKFILNYVFKKGYKDGYPGLIHAFIMSTHSLLVRIKLYEQKIYSNT